MLKKPIKVLCQGRKSFLAGHPINNLRCQTK
jgi:hypothetical protein